jgi:hypothetical protein
MVSTLLDLVGVLCLAAFAYLLFPPATLAVVGLAALLASRTLTRPVRGGRP